VLSICLVILKCLLCILFSDFQEAIQDEEKGKKKKIKTMETIKEETLSALRAFLTPVAEDDEQGE
jgi:hypothetical protein